MAKPAKAKMEGFGLSKTRPEGAEHEKLLAQLARDAIPVEDDGIGSVVTEAGDPVTIIPDGRVILLCAKGAHAPLCPSARLTLAEAEAVIKQLGKACAKLRGIAARPS